MFLPITALLITAILGRQPLERKEIFKPGLYLVRAKALDFSYDQKGQARCIFQIEHVFVGSDSLKKECFEAWGKPPAAGFGQFGNWTSPEIKKGEDSIWWITERPKQKKEGVTGKENRKKPRLIAAENNSTIARVVLFPPVRRIVHLASESDDECIKEEWKKEEEWYTYIEKCALGMETVYRANDDKRLDLLKGLGRRDLPLLQGWCLVRLKAVLSKEEYVTYLTDVASTARLHLLMEHEVDCQLSGLSQTWLNSEARLKFFQRWMNGALINGKRETEENDIIYILFRTDWSDLSCLVFMRLMLDGLSTDNRSEDFKTRLLTIRGCRPKDLASIDDAFAYLMRQLRSAEPSRRLAAARLLSHFVPLCKTQEIAVQALVEDPTYKALAVPLTEALEQTALVLDGLSGIDGAKWGRAEKQEFLWTRLLRRASQPQAIRFIGEHVRPVATVEPDHVRQLISDLDHEHFRRREEASRELAATGLESEPILRVALERTNSAEVRRRLEPLVAQFTKERIITLRAIPILARYSSPEAQTLLGKLAAGCPRSQITREAKSALQAREKEEKGKRKGRNP